VAYTVAVDFDGVIHMYSRGWGDGTVYDDPMPGAFETIRMLQDTGIAVYVFTSRNVEQVVEWWKKNTSIAVIADDEVQENGGPVQFWNETSVVLVSNRKLPAVAYLDDRAVVFESWSTALRQIMKLVNR
jgi:hypothetical protein